MREKGKQNLAANPLRYARRLFLDSNLRPPPDGELSDLVASAGQHLTDEDLTRLLAAQKRFDGPVTMLETGEVVEHYRLRRTFKLLPEYMQAASVAGLTYKQANAVLHKYFTSEPYEFNDPSLLIHLLGRAYRQAAASGVKISQSIGTFKKMIALGAKSGVVDGNVYAFTIALRLGLSVDQACRIVMRIPEAEGGAAGYPVPHFNDAIKSMLPARVNPDLVVEAFDVLGGDRPWMNMGDYQGFKQLMTYGCPILGITPNEMLAKFVARAKNRRRRTPLLETVASKIESDQNDCVTVSHPRDRYFTETSGKLEHAAQPYRNQRSLNDGIRDLETLAIASHGDWDEVGMGMWVFDPASSTWYSLGGELELPGMANILSGRANYVRHNFVRYDISELSATPLLFHVNPEGLDSFIAPSRESMAFPRLRDNITKFLTATPSRADYETAAELLKGSHHSVPLRSFIAHKLGVTEFSYPADIERIEDMKVRARDIRDQVMVECDPLDIVINYGFETLPFVQRLMGELNSRLPQGFGIVMYPTGKQYTPSMR